MSPHVQNRQHRIIWEGETGPVGWWLGIGFMAYGAFVIWPDGEPLPWRVTNILIPWWMSEAVLGGVLFALGFLQWFFADVKWTKARYVIAATLFVVLGYILYAYVQVGEVERRMVPIMAAACLAQFWVAWRAHHDRRIARLLLERRRASD